MSKNSLFFLLFFVCINAVAQKQPRFIVGGDTLAWFDFWVGDWDLMWYVKDSVKLYGKNRIEKILNGTAIQENFEGLTGNTKGYQGKSFSIYDISQKAWRQTWVDNSNSYISLVGGREQETFFFSSNRVNANGKKQIDKMVFRDIKPNSFVWDWKSSIDDGKTWTVNWQIFYTRKSN